MSQRTNYPLRYVLVAAWVLFNFSLTAWWVFFGLEQIERLGALGYVGGDELVRYQKMLLWEGGTLIFSLIAGGITLTYYIYRELLQSRRVHDFFLTFTHDLKTSLATVLLQSEMIRERFETDADKGLADRFIADTSKLALHLSNALALAQLHDRVQYPEAVRLSDLVRNLQGKFAGMRVTLQGDFVVKGDRAALDSILGNIAQNALSHGGASELSIRGERRGSDIIVSIVDNGSGFSGERCRLGERFFRHYSGSGSGLGLFLAREMLTSMNGQIGFPIVEKGFAVSLTLPEGILGAECKEAA